MGEGERGGGVFGKNLGEGVGGGGVRCHPRLSSRYHRHRMAHASMSPRSRLRPRRLNRSIGAEPKVMFVDFAGVEITAGTGGSGLEAFRREKYVARGGPSGGDGGRGGHVILEVDPQLATLLDFSYQKKCRAERGEHGQSKNMTGRDGEDLVLKVPPGTIVRDQDTCEVLAQLVEPGQRVIAARGGRGGRGGPALVRPARRSASHGGVR